MSDSIDQFVPGAWYCPKCGFENYRRILHVRDGGVSADKTITDSACPNDGELMLQLTWKKHAEGLAKVCENQIARAVNAEETIDALNVKLKEALEGEAYADKCLCELWDKLGARGLPDEQDAAIDRIRELIAKEGELGDLIEQLKQTP